MVQSKEFQFQGLYGPFVAKLRLFEAALEGKRLNFYLFMGLRTFAQQDALYARGRTSPGSPCWHDGRLYPVGTCRAHPFGLIVTAARGGQSWHNYGLAADYVLNLATGKLALRLSWDTSADDNADHVPDYLELGPAAAQVGLEWGGAWPHLKDFPHVEDTYGLGLTEAQELHRRGGIPAVWAECTKRLPPAPPKMQPLGPSPFPQPVSPPETVDSAPPSPDAATGLPGPKNE